MRGFDVKESGVNRDMWLNGAVCAYWAGCAVLVRKCANGAAGIADAGDGCNGGNYSHSKKEKINEQESN